jgi:hypothetical protein
VISTKSPFAGLRLQISSRFALLFLAIFYFFGSLLLSALLSALMDDVRPRGMGWQDCSDCLSLVWMWPYDVVALFMVATIPAFLLVRNMGLRRALVYGLLMTSLGIFFHISIIFYGQVQQFHLIGAPFFETLAAHIRGTWNMILSPFSRQIPLFWLLAMIVLPTVMTIADRFSKIQALKFYQRA